APVAGWRSVAGEHMSWFLVERTMPGLTEAGLTALQRALRAATRRLSTPSAPVRYVGSVYLPRRDACLCLFEAAEPRLVREANETAQAPFSRIQEAEVRPGDGGVESTRSTP